MEIEEKKENLISTLLFCVALMIIFGGIYLQKSIHLTKVCTQETESTIVEITTRKESEGHLYTTYYYPVLSYTVDGKEYKGEGDKSRNSSEYGIGDIVSIRYNPENPKEFYMIGANGSNAVQKLANNIDVDFILLLVIIWAIYILAKVKQCYL